MPPTPRCTQSISGRGALYVLLTGVFGVEGRGVSLRGLVVARRIIKHVEAIVAPVRIVEGKIFLLLGIRVHNERGSASHPNDACRVALLLT